MKNNLINEVNILIDKKFSEIQWSEYKIDDLFEKINTNNISNNELGDLPATTASISNNQISKYISRENATILKNVFSATANGDGKAFYQGNEFTILQDSYAFKFKDNDIKIEKIYPFVIECLNNTLSKYNWCNKSGWNRVKEDTILLPSKNGQPDYIIMEEIVSEIDVQNIIKVKGYLKSKGITDIALTEEEKELLLTFRSKNK